MRSPAGVPQNCSRRRSHRTTTCTAHALVSRRENRAGARAQGVSGGPCSPAARGAADQMPCCKPTALSPVHMHTQGGRLSQAPPRAARARQAGRRRRTRRRRARCELGRGAAGAQGGACVHPVLGYLPFAIRTRSSKSIVKGGSRAALVRLFRARRANLRVRVVTTRLARCETDSDF